jgi:hypothetical protein
MLFSSIPASPDGPAGYWHAERLENHIDIIDQPRPEERALARVSKDGRRRQGRATASILRDAMLRMAPQDEVRGIGAGKKIGAEPADCMWPNCTSARDFSVSVNFPK